MKIISKLNPILGLTILVFFGSGCEKPSLSEKAAPEPVKKEEPIVKTPLPQPPPKPEPASAPDPEPIKAAAEKKEQVEADVEPSLPEFFGSISGDTIELEGAIKSRFALERMIKDLKREFPDHQVVNKVENDSDRIPVKWTGRVAAQFLIPFFKQVPDGIVSYDSGTVHLTGTMTNQRSFRSLQIAANETFQDTHTVKIQNELVAGSDDNTNPRPRNK